MNQANKRGDGARGYLSRCRHSGVDISRRRAEETNRRKNDGAEGSKYTADAGRRPQFNRSSREKQKFHKRTSTKKVQVNKNRERRS